MKIKVCYMIGSFAMGGAEGQLLELLRKIDRERFETSLILQSTQGLDRVDGLVADVKSLNIEQHPRGVARGYRASLSLAKVCTLLGELCPDILHAFLPAACIFGAGGRLLTKTPCFISSRRSLVDSYRPNSKLQAIADVMATRASDFVLGNSQAIVNEIVCTDGVPKSRTQVIYNGVDTRRFSPLKRPGMRGEFGWTEHQLVFGMVANFIGYKRHIDFVRAAAMIHVAVPEARFLLVGEDRGEMPAVQKAIAQAGLDSHTRILPGTRTPEEAFAAMDVYICSSETEGFSNVLLEAMAMGLPVIATSVGGNPEALAEGVNGTLVPAHAPELIARAAVELAADPGRLRQWAANSRRRAEERFSLDTMVHAHQDLYTRLTSRKQASTWKRLANRV
jgi:glycosyltransferase involved in cell wall biosynthesis